MPRRPGDPNQSYPRRGDPNASLPRRGYGDVDERGLMVAPDAGGIMPQFDDRALPALPTEEEERALGIRRPAFIPATDERKGTKPGRWRVISGVLSIMLVCVGACGLSGVLVQRNVFPGISKLLGLSTLKNVSTPLLTVPTIYAGMAPLVTPVPGAKTPIQNIKSYKYITAAKVAGSPDTPHDPTDIFDVNQLIYIVGDANDQVKAKDVFSANWFYNGQQQASSSVTVMHDNTPLQLEFKYGYPTIGNGRVDIYYNKTLAYQVLFYITVPSQTPTPTPASHTTPTPIATKHP